MKRREFIASLSLLPIILPNNRDEKPKSVTSGDKTLKMVNGNTITFKDYRDGYNEAWESVQYRVGYMYSEHPIPRDQFECLMRGVQKSHAISP